MQLSERHRLHLSGATHEKASDYNSLFHKKIRQYGIKNFNLVILEEVEDKEDLDSREQYWIKEKHSFIRDENGIGGYNLTTGGQYRKDNENYWDIRCSLNREQALQIIALLKDTNRQQTEIAKDFNINVGIVNQINQGKKYRLLGDRDYPIRKNLSRQTSNEEIEAIIELLKQGYGNVEIARMIGNGLSEMTVSNINRGKKHFNPELKYPIRKESKTSLSRRERADKIKQLLEENKLNNKQIADLVGVDPSNVSNINYGKSWHDENRTYPIRK